MKALQGYGRIIRLSNHRLNKYHTPSLRAIRPMLKGGDEEMKKVIAVVMGVVLLLSLVPAGVVLADKPSDEVTGE